MLQLFFNYLKDEDGQTSTEYILLVVVVAFIIMKFKGTLQSKLEGLIDNVFNKANALVNE